MPNALTPYELSELALSSIVEVLSEAKQAIIEGWSHEQWIEEGNFDDAAVTEAMDDPDTVRFASCGIALKHIIKLVPADRRLTFIIRAFGMELRRATEGPSPTTADQGEEWKS